MGELPCSSRQAYRQPGYWTQGWQDWNAAVNPQGHESCLLVAAGVQFLRVAKLPRLIRDDGMCSRGLFFFVPCERAELRVGQFAWKARGKYNLHAGQLPFSHHAR